MTKRLNPTRVKKRTPLAPLLMISAFGILSCNGGSNGAPYFNNPAPSGTVIDSGSFPPGGEVTGTVLVYDEGNGNYIIRLAELQTPSDPGLQLQADTTTDGSRQCTQGLFGYSGNQNYNCDLGQPTGFTVVYIHSPAQNQDIGIATLQ